MIVWVCRVGWVYAQVIVRIVKIGWICRVGWALRPSNSKDSYDSLGM
jgi:hypothetical protein